LDEIRVNSAFKLDNPASTTGPFDYRRHKTRQQGTIEGKAVFSGRQSLNPTGGAMTGSFGTADRNLWHRSCSISPCRTPGNQAVAAVVRGLDARLFHS
jgi:hypothetical protein